MREVRNKVKDRNYPVQEQTEFNNFVTAAPGLPVHLCGGGVMPECVNLEITNNGLVPRAPMRKLVHFDFGYGYTDSSGILHDYDPLREYCHIISYRRGGRDDILFLEKIGKAYELGNAGYRSAARGNMFDFNDSGISEADLDRMALEDVEGRQFYGNLSLIVGRKANVLNYTEPLFSSRALDCNGIARLRQFGLPQPEYAFINDGGGSLVRWVGIEYAVKNDEGIIIRSSGIVNKRGKSHALRIPDATLGLAAKFGITHILVYVSELYGDSAENRLGTPTQMYLLAEVPLSDVFFDGLKHDESMDSDYNETGTRWIVSYGKGSNNVPKIIISMGTDSEHKVREPSTFADIFVFNDDIQEDFNLIPMENALCFAGNRLWGAVGSQAIYAHEAGSPRQEQRMPVAMVECGVGNIIDMVELNGHLYVFGAKGIVRIDNADANSLAGKPHQISNKSCTTAKVKAVSSFGVFAILDGVLMFLDADTLDYSTSVKGLDLGKMLGELTSFVANFEIFCGNLFFTAQGRLFKLNITQNKGLTEITHADFLTPISLANLDNKGLAVLYKGFDDNEDKMKLYLWDLLTNDEPNYYPEDVSRILYYASFALATLHGWVEHWDTSVLALLPKDAKVGTETITDGLYHLGNTAGSDWDSNHPRNFLIPAGKKERPIGQALAVRVSVRVSEYKEGMAIHSVKITSIKQEEVFNTKFNPNARTGIEFMLAGDDGIFYEQEGSNNG